MLERIREQLSPIRLQLDALLARARRAAEPALAQSRARYQKLEPRERVLVQIAAVIVGLFLAYNLVYAPIEGLRESLRDEARARQTELVTVRRLVENCLRLRTQLTEAEGRTVPPGKDFSLFSVIEGALTKSVGRAKIGSITPSERKISDQLMQHEVQLKLNDVSLAQIVDTLYGVRSLSVPVTVTSITITRREQNPHSYDVEFNCAAVGKNG